MQETYDGSVPPGIDVPYVEDHTQAAEQKAVANHEDVDPNHIPTTWLEDDIEPEWLDEQKALEAHQYDLEAAETLVARIHKTEAERRRACQFIHDEMAEHQAALNVLAARALEISKPFERKLEYLYSFKPALIECAREELAHRGKGRTLKLAYGSVAFRKATAVVKIENRELLTSWAMVQAPELLTVPVPELRKWIEEVGEAVPGATYEPQPDTVAITIEP